MSYIGVNRLSLIKWGVKWYKLMTYVNDQDVLATFEI
jgi:hypothetical protein